LTLRNFTTIFQPVSTGAKLGLLALAAVLLAAPSAWAESMKGKVIAVNSGDSITILTEKDQVVPVRLANIDAPEIKQSFGPQAQRFVENRALGLTVKVNYVWTDRHRRLIGDVVLPDGKLLNEVVLRAGYAWHYRVQAPFSPVLSQIEYQAWKGKMGLWIENHPVPPWEFRREETIPAPPDKPERTDYDKILMYGIVGDPKTRLYYWPSCKRYPGKLEGTRVFANKLEAESLGFRAARECRVD